MLCRATLLLTRVLLYNRFQKEHHKRIYRSDKLPSGELLPAQCFCLLWLIADKSNKLEAVNDKRDKNKYGIVYTILPERKFMSL